MPSGDQLAHSLFSENGTQSIRSSKAPEEDERIISKFINNPPRDFISGTETIVLEQEIDDNYTVNYQLSNNCDAYSKISLETEFEIDEKYLPGIHNFRGSVVNDHKAKFNFLYGDHDKYLQDIIDDKTAGDLKKIDLDENFLINIISDVSVKSGTQTIQRLSGKDIYVRNITEKKNFKPYFQTIGPSTPSPDNRSVDFKTPFTGRQEEDIINDYLTDHFNLLNYNGDGSGGHDRTSFNLGKDEANSVEFYGLDIFKALKLEDNSDYDINNFGPTSGLTCSKQFYDHYFQNINDFLKLFQPKIDELGATARLDDGLSGFTTTNGAYTSAGAAEAHGPFIGDFSGLSNQIENLSAELLKAGKESLTNFDISKKLSNILPTPGTRRILLKFLKERLFEDSKNENVGAPENDEYKISHTTHKLLSKRRNVELINVLEQMLIDTTPRKSYFESGNSENFINNDNGIIDIMSLALLPSSQEITQNKDKFRKLLFTIDLKLFTGSGNLSNSYLQCATPNQPLTITIKFKSDYAVKVLKPIGFLGGEVKNLFDTTFTSDGVGTQTTYGPGGGIGFGDLIDPFYEDRSVDAFNPNSIFPINQEIIVGGGAEGNAAVSSELSTSHCATPADTIDNNIQPQLIKQLNQFRLSSQDHMYRYIKQNFITRLNVTKHTMTDFERQHIQNNLVNTVINSSTSTEFNNNQYTIRNTLNDHYYQFEDLTFWSVVKEDTSSDGKINIKRKEVSNDDTRKAILNLGHVPLNVSHLIIMLSDSDNVKNNTAVLLSAQLKLGGTLFGGKYSGAFLKNESLDILNLVSPKKSSEQNIYVLPIASEKFGTDSLPFNKLKNIQLELEYVKYRDGSQRIKEDPTINITAVGTNVLSYSGGTAIVNF